MGGGMVYGEPHNYGFRYPEYSSGFPPRRQSSFWGDESFPEEVTNLARKRKLDGVKGEPLEISNGKTVREIFVEDPSMSKISPIYELQGYGNAPASRGSSPPTSPPVRGGSKSSAPNEGHTVTIPVVFSSEAAKQRPVPVVPQEGTKKPKRTLSAEAAAVMIQSVFRGYVVRRTKPLEHMRKISTIRTKLRDFERQLSDASIVEKMRSDFKVRLRITEGIMTLLLQLDAIQGVHPDIRTWRKAVTKEVVTLQERVDVLLKGGETMGTEPASVELAVEGHNEDTAMVVEEDNAAEDHVSENDVVITEIVHRESEPKCRDMKDTWAEEIGLEQLKLRDGEVGCQSDKMAFVLEMCDDVGECIGRDSGVQGSECAARTEQIVERREAVQNGGLVGGLVSEGNDNGYQHTVLTSQVAYNNGAAGCEPIDSTRQPLNDECEMKTEESEKNDDVLRGEEFHTVRTGATRLTEGECTDVPVETESSETLEIVDASAIAEQGMEVDREKSSPEERVEESPRTPDEFECRLNRSPNEQERMKYFLKDLSTTSESAVPVPHWAGLNEAEEMDCHGAPSSELEENDGVVSKSGLRTRHGKDDSAEGGGASGRTEKSEHDPLLSKLCEENRMLKLLLLDVMKWNQLQANSMRNVTERLEKLEDRLLSKQKKSSSKPQTQRCNRTRLERRLRR